VLVQTVAQRARRAGNNEGNSRAEADYNEEVEVVVEKQRQTPLSSWIGKQPFGQNIPKKNLDKDGKLTIMKGYPHGLLAIPSEGYCGRRILVPVHGQKELFKSTHA
jgi:hypothetical protein